MPINDEDSTSQQNGNVRNAQAKAPPSDGWTFHSLGVFETPIPRAAGTEYYTKFRDKLTEIYKQANKNIEIGVLELSRATDPALDFSCVLVATRLHALRDTIAVHILLLAETGEEYQPYIEQMQDRQIGVYRQSSDAINKILIDKAVRVVQTTYGVKNVIFVDGTVVQRNFDVEGKTTESQAAYQELALNASIAGVTELQQGLPDFKDLNLYSLQGGTQALVDVTFQKTQQKDCAGNIFRSDCSVTFSDRKGGENPRDRVPNTGERTTKFSVVNLLIDPVWSPVQPNGDSAYFMPQQMAPTQKFAARAVITDIRAGFAQTPAATLLAVASAMGIKQNNAWFAAMRPMQTGRKEIDITDIGALNIEANLPVPQPNMAVLAQDPSGYGKPIDTKADDFKYEQLYVYIASIFQKDIMISMDVPEFGPQTHFLSLFAAAAKGTQGAIEKIVNAANELSNGQFQNHFRSGMQIFATSSERIHAGTWTDHTGQIRDLRDFDHTAVANLVGTRNPSLIRDWSDTYLRPEFPEIQRLDARRKIIQQLSGDTAKFTGWYQRVTFSRDFLSALDLSISSYLKVAVRTPLSGSDFSNQRGVATWAQSAMLGFPQHFTVQGGYQQAPNQQGNYVQYRY